MKLYVGINEIRIYVLLQESKSETSQEPDTVSCLAISSKPNDCVPVDRRILKSNSNGAANESTSVYDSASNQFISHRGQTKRSEPDCYSASLIAKDGFENVLMPSSADEVNKVEVDYFDSIESTTSTIDSDTEERNKSSAVGTFLSDNTQIDENFKKQQSPLRSSCIASSACITPHNALPNHNVFSTNTLVVLLKCSEEGKEIIQYAAKAELSEAK